MEDKKQEKEISKALKKGLVVSALVHLTLIAILAFTSPMGCGGGNGSGKGKGADQNKSHGMDGDDLEDGSIIPKDKKEEPKVEIIEENAPGKEVPEPKHAKDECPDFFGGIGVQYSAEEYGRIIDVPYGYPAYDAGIRAGDRIVSPSLGWIRGEVGTEVKVTYENTTGLHEITLIRDKICIKKGLESPYP